jgi:hypothetical protein
VINKSAQCLPCCIEAPPDFVPKAQYTLRMLLLPLNLDPVWVTRDQLTGTGLYYGTELSGLSAAIVALPLLSETVRYFTARTAYEPGGVLWVPWQERSWPVLFGTATHPDGVASAFFWLSGWQEHTLVARDPYGRFSHAGSLQARLGITTLPVVDGYRAMLAEQLAGAGVPVQPRQWAGHRWAFCPTHDIDYLRKWRPGLVYREVVAYLLANARKQPLPERLRRFRAFLADWLRPGDVYRASFVRLRTETIRRGGTATFFLKAEARSRYDVYYRLADPWLRRQLAHLAADGFEVGLHPGFHSYRHPACLARERARLSQVLPTPPCSIRQHYLRYDLPVTPRMQQQSGFEIDSTLGFAEHEGFRHATCQPFQVFDPVANAPLELWEMPLCLMEAALFNRRQLSAEQAHTATTDLLRTVQRFGGAAVMLWHNTLWDELDHPGWGQHFLDTLDDAVQAEGHIASLQQALAGWQ